MSLRERNKARARQSILDAAHELIAEVDVADATTREIARRAGVSYQTLYNYYPTKASVLQGVLADDMAAWAGDVQFAIKRYHGDLLETLREIGEIGAAHFAGPRSDLWLAIAGAFFDNASNKGGTALELTQTEFDSLIGVANERYHELLALAQGTGELKPDVDLHLLAYTLFGLTEYAVLRYFAEPESTIEATLRLLDEQMQMIVGPYLNV